MPVFGRREAWPAVAILGIGLLTLGMALKAAQESMPLQPTWVMGLLAGLYAVLACTAAGFTWRAPVLLAAMAAAHALLALLMGWGYAAVDGTPRDAYAALTEGLWNYVPGTALQFGFACVLGIVLEAHLEREPAGAADDDDEEAPWAPMEFPDFALCTDLQSAVDAAVGVPAVSGALLLVGETVGGGIWQRDPASARGRVEALVGRTGTGLNSFTLDHVNLLTRSENGRLAAVIDLLP